jgi:SAM-dependent methyltransferase
MSNKRFDPKKLNKLNNPERLIEIPPEKIFQLAQLENPQVIIDYGAGTAFFSKAISKLFKKCKIYACDISEIMVDWMNNNIVPDFNNIFPIKMEDNKVPLKNEIADFLIMINLHHELDEPEKTLRECSRLLKNNSKIAISDWKKEDTKKGPALEIRYEPETIKLQLKNSGFDNINIHTDFTNNFLIIAEKIKNIV